MFVAPPSEAERSSTLRMRFYKATGTPLVAESFSLRGAFPLKCTGPMSKALASVPDELEETLRWATERLREIYGPRLKHLILFGPEARGDAGPESDVDLLVLLEEPITSIEEAKRTSPVATQAATYRDTALSFVHTSEEEFARGRSPLVWSVREDGIDLLVLFSKSPPP